MAPIAASACSAAQLHDRCGEPEQHDEAAGKAAEIDRGDARVVEARIDEEPRMSASDTAIAIMSPERRPAGNMRDAMAEQGRGRHMPRARKRPHGEGERDQEAEDRGESASGTTSTAR